MLFGEWAVTVDWQFRCCCRSSWQVHRSSVGSAVWGMGSDGGLIVSLLAILTCLGLANIQVSHACQDCKTSPNAELVIELCVPSSGVFKSSHVIMLSGAVEFVRYFRLINVPKCGACHLPNSRVRRVRSAKISPRSFRRVLSRVCACLCVVCSVCVCVFFLGLPCPLSLPLSLCVRFGGP